MRAGEVVGIAGVAGNGQSELFAALSGERLSPRATILIDGRPVGDRGIDARRQMGAAFVPEERLGHSAVPGLALSDNVILSRHATGGIIRSGFLMRPQRRCAWRPKFRSVFDVRQGSDDPEAASLSGGNLQKFVIGREILAEPGVIVVDQPSWGVDVGAAVTIRQALIDLAAKGAAVLVISQDLDEILEIADRIAVIAHGHLSPAEPARALTRERIGLLMGGARPELAERVHAD